MSPGNSEKLDTVFHALSDATRRAILEELSRREDQTLYELCTRLITKRHLALSRQAISKHLAVLENAQLIKTRWDGRTKLHASNLHHVRSLLNQWFNAHSEE